MTKSLSAMGMNERGPSFGSKRSCRVSRLGILGLLLAFLLTYLVSVWIAYMIAPCTNGRDLEGNVNEPELAASSNSRSGKAFLGSTKKKIDVRLPRSLLPHSYEVDLVPFIWPGNFTFNGQVRILVNATEGTNKIILHAVDMLIDKEATTVMEYSKTKKVNDLEVVAQSNDTERQFYMIEVKQALEAGKQYLVSMKYTGKLNDVLQGFYRSSYLENNQTRWIAATQFQPTDARRAFPCFDEPALKATFQINIARPRNMSAISNMPREKQTEKVEGLPTYIWDHFQRSVPMSTYLVAFIVLDFEALHSESGNVSAWVRKDAIQQAAYSLKIAPQILRHYENFFQIRYPLPKTDMVALPDFSAGAMENWGLITYRETAMLYRDGVSSPWNKQRVATVVAHELAHQWFGNLVTPSWWSDLWLNEGFATYMEYIGMNAVEPSWKTLEQFVVNDLQGVFALDALESSHPISVVVGNPDEINEIFDRISYEKGASIIRMMDHFLTSAVFQKGLTNYLNSRAYQSAEQDDLWNALTLQAHKDKILDYDVTVKQIMDTWTLQTGFPIVTVKRDYDNDAAIITQERFKYGNNSKSAEEDLWWIPLTYTTASKSDFKSTKPFRWMKNEKTILQKNMGARSNEWLIFNILETGYYRVNYDRKNWEMIIKHLQGLEFISIPTINRAQLLDDALNLARAGKLDYSIALDVMSYLKRETEYLPWKSALTAINFLEGVLVKYPNYDKFREYTLELLDNVYHKVGFRDSSSDDQLESFLRQDVLSLACSLGHEDCLKQANRQFSTWRSNEDPDRDNPISPNLKHVVYCTAVRVGGEPEWKFMWQRYLKANVGSEKDLLLHALGCSREVWLLSRYLDWALTENSGIRKQDVARVFGSVSSNAVGQGLSFDYCRNRWDQLKKYFGTSLLSLNNVVKVSTKRIVTRNELKDLIDFANEHKDELGSATRSVEQAIEQAESNIRWIEANHATIHDWLKRKTS